MKKLGFLTIVLSLFGGSHLLVAGATAAGVTQNVTVQNSQGMGVKYEYVVPAGTTNLSTTYDKSYIRGRTDTSGYKTWGKVWLQFDLRDIWAKYGKENLISASLTIWGENGTTRRFSVAGLTDGLDESWQMLNLTWNNAPGNDPASGTSLNPSKIHGGAALWRVHTASVDAVVTNLGNNDDGSNFDQAARYESISPANELIKAFLLTDTNGLVTLIGYDHTNSSNQNWWTGIGGLYASDVANGYVTTDSGERLRNSPTLTLTFPPDGADNPTPYPDDIVDSSLAELSWTNPDPNDGAGPITCTVYLGVDPNRPEMDSITLAPGVHRVAINTDNFPTYGNLQNLTTYYWTVDCDDPSDRLIPGLMWNFLVNNNNPPVVDAGPDQNVWLGKSGTSGQEVVNLDGTVTDDGLPKGSVLTYQWTQVSGPAVAITPGNVEDTSVILTERGAYEFMLTANDGGIYPDVSATVRIVVGDTACDASHIKTGANYYSGDFNKDCIVDLQDFVVMAAGWLNCTDTLNNCGN